MQSSMMMRTPQSFGLLLLLFVSGVCTKKRLQGFNNEVDNDGKDGASWSQRFPRARCMSRCLSLHSAASRQNNGTLPWCRSHRECAKCLDPCKDSWSTKRKSNCKDLCKELFPMNHWECVASCEFLQTILEVKQGGCPLPTLASGFAAACVDSCDHDTECPAQKKCCSNNCGHTCQYPQDIYEGVPLKPRKKLDFEETRWNFGIQPNGDAATSWDVVAQTTEHRTRLYNIRPGRWYQFRVAAVNVHGTRGFTTPSRPICSSREPPRPPAPTELSVTNITFASSQTVLVQLQWHMLEDLDVPVDHYKVRWTWTTIGQSPVSSLTKRRKLVRERQVVLDGMRTGRTYSVEVQAVSYWKQTQLKGPRAIVHFSTQLSPYNTTALPKSPVADNLHVGTPFYQNGQLHVHVYWQRSTDPSVEYYRIQWLPEYCEHKENIHREKSSTKETFTSLQGLLFSCKYKVLLQPVSRTSRPPAKSICFTTPSCPAIQAKSPSPIGCNRGALSPQKALVKPTHLTVAFMVRGGNLTAIFNWETSAGSSQRQLTGYRVTLVEVTSISPLNNSNFYQTHILNPDVNNLAVSDLHLASVYRLVVQGITADGEGSAISRTFQTPAFQHLLKHIKDD
ncbi:anosmin-1-like isoform X3 [Stigmatopora argus]